VAAVTVYSAPDDGRNGSTLWQTPVASVTVYNAPDDGRNGSTAWQTPVAAVTVYSAPDDGRNVSTAWQRPVAAVAVIVLLKMATKGVRNMYSILVVVNKHNTARVASCWFIIYYINLLQIWHLALWHDFI